MPKENAGVQVIGRAVDLLRALAVPGGRTQTELSQHLGLPRTTVHRILRSLEDQNMITVGPGGRARIGPEIVRLAEASRRDLGSILRSELEALSREAGETVDFAVQEGSTVRFLDQVIAPQPLQAVSAVGVAFPLYVCASGKAILAELPEERVRALLPSRLRAFTANTVVTLPALLEELAVVRARGFAWDHEEHTVGISAVAVALPGPYGDFYALSIPAPTQRIAEREEELAALLNGARDAIARQLDRWSAESGT